MKKTVTIFFLFFALMSYAQQNLVVNPSFEEYNVCPTGAGQINKAVGWDKPMGHVGTPDYHNSCSSNPEASVPATNHSYQYPHNGNAYAIIILYQPKVLPFTNAYGVEYITGSLASTLTIGKTYKISFYYSLVDSSNYTVTGLGAFLSPNKPQATIKDTILPVTPQFKMNTHLAMDTSLWHPISFQYKAVGNESYITIGMFNKRTQTSPYMWRKGVWESCSIYIDDVKVQEALEVWGDTLICKGDTITMYSNIIANWALASKPDSIIGIGDSIQLSPASTTSYIAFNSDDTVEFTIYVIENALPLNLPSDTTICKGEKIVLDATHLVYQKYLWNTGETTAAITVSSAGIYTVIASLARGNGCISTDTVSVQLYELPIVTLPDDTALCIEEVQIILDAGLWKSYLWYPTDQTTRTINVETAALYRVVVTDTNNCKGSDDVAIDDNCPTTFYVPNVFIPDANNLNDVFEPRGLNIASYKMFIIDRWGKIIYEGNTAWDGTYNNKPAEIGVYGYIVEAKTKKGKLLNKKGMVTLLR